MTKSPWHAGERAVHDRLGERALADRMHIGSEVSDVADDFLREQTLVYVSALVGSEVWVTPLTGQAGFSRGSGDEDVTVDSRPPTGDPLANTLAGVTRIGVLAIEPATRRRIRLNGVSTPTPAGLVIALDQMYGNCPRFIQKRTAGATALDVDASAPVVSATLTARQVRLLQSADTFVIGTADRDGNADASHRGGSPGFVRVVDEAHFRFPDYAGNHMYMTLGNLEVQPSAGFLFVDWEPGATVQVTGTAVVDFDPARAEAEFPGAARIVDVAVTSVVETAGRLPGSWTAPSTHGSIRQHAAPRSPQSERPREDRGMELAHDAGPTDVPLLDETIGANLARTIAAHGSNEALVARHQGIRWTYDEFGERVDRLSAGLMGLGLNAGDRVGLWSPNYAEWTLLQYATAAIGAVLVNINPAYRTHELAYALQQSECRMLFAAPSFKTSDYMEMVDQVASKQSSTIPTLERAVFFWEDDWDEIVAGTGAVSAADLAARKASLSPDDPINIQYTSGTTGFPKGATLTHRNILNNGYFVTRRQEFTPADRLCIPVPFYHCFGMVMGNLGCTTQGATMVIPADAFDPTHVLETVEAERCTALYGVPTMFIAELGLANFGDYDLSSLRTGVMAGSPCPVEVMKACVDRMHMTAVTICYGMTETSPVSTQTLPDDSMHHRTATVGRAHPHVEIRVADPDSGQTVARGDAGEFCTRGYSVMQGYWNDPERTADAIDADGWMHTGDLAVMADDGYVNIVGRIKDMVIRGGENVYPREVEEFFYTHPAVADVQVIGVPDERYGEELMAWVKLQPGATATEDEIRDFCRGKIAHYKIPRYVRFVDEFPMTVTGKVQKYLMREKSIEELGLTAAETA